MIPELGEGDQVGIGSSNPEIRLCQGFETDLSFKSNNLLQSNSSDEIEVWVDQVLLMHPEKVIEYKKGKKGLIGLFTGEVKKLSQGKADPKMTMQLLEQKLK